MAQPNESPEPDVPILNVSESEFDCALCLKMLFDPVTTPDCGHTFCRLCLIRALETKKRCPLCRHPCHVDPLSQPTTHIVSQLLEKHARQTYRAREAEAYVDKRARKKRLYIFLVGTPIFPGTILNLHIFEPRYRILVDRAWSTSRQFVMLKENGEVGCIVRITRCRILPDGRSLIEIRGEQRARVSEVREEDNTEGLLSCEIEELPDRPQPSPQANPQPSPDNAGPAEEKLEPEHKEPEQKDGGPVLPSDSIEELVRLARDRLDAFMRMESFSHERFIQIYGEPPQDPVEFSFFICRAIPARDELLESALATHSVTERLRLCINILDESIHNTRRNRTMMLVAIVLFAILYLIWYNLQEPFHGQAHGWHGNGGEKENGPAPRPVYF